MSLGDRVEIDKLHSGVPGIPFSESWHWRTDHLIAYTEAPPAQGPTQEHKKHHPKTETLICGGGGSDQVEQGAAVETGAIWDDAC